MSEYSLKVEKLITASAEMVFDAWLDQENINKWLMPADGITVPNPEIDARVGGKFSLAMQVGDQLLPHSGEYRVIDRPNKLQFTWNSPHGTNGEDTLVTILIESKDGGTLVSLVHESLPTEQQRDNHQGGWGRILEHLNQHSQK